MMKYIITFAIFVQMAYCQDINDYSPETVSEWSSGKYFNDLNEICIEDCNKTCVQKCPVPDLCKDDEIQCGKEDLPLGVWPDCIRDDICVPDGCECMYNLKYSRLISNNSNICNHYNLDVLQIFEQVKHLAMMVLFAQCGV